MDLRKRRIISRTVWQLLIVTAIMFAIGAMSRCRADRVERQQNEALQQVDDNAEE